MKTKEGSDGSVNLWDKLFNNRDEHDLRKVAQVRRKENPMPRHRTIEIGRRARRGGVKNANTFFSGIAPK